MSWHDLIARPTHPLPPVFYLLNAQFFSFFNCSLLSGQRETNLWESGKLLPPGVWPRARASPESAFCRIKGEGRGLLGHPHIFANLVVVGAKGSVGY